MGETPETLVPRTVREEGSVYGAAVKLGVSRNTIAYWLKKMGIKVETQRVTTIEEPHSKGV
jgi:transcriptional regulator with GAF, ATPase, and Fis domain